MFFTVEILFYSILFYFLFIHDEAQTSRTLHRNQSPSDSRTEMYNVPSAHLPHPINQPCQTIFKSSCYVKLSVCLSDILSVAIIKGCTRCHTVTLSLSLSTHVHPFRRWVPINLFFRWTYPGRCIRLLQSLWLVWLMTSRVTTISISAIVQNMYYSLFYSFSTSYITMCLIYVFLISNITAVLGTVVFLFSRGAVSS